VVDWKPISESSLWDLLNGAEFRMDVDVARFWEAVRVPPEKWVLHPYGDIGGGFWVVGILGPRVIWFNDIEDGFNVSEYRSPGEIADYWCDQHQLEVVLQQLLHFVQTGSPLVGRAGPPVEGVYRDA
jgi:hypothetical protein